MGELHLIDGVAEEGIFLQEGLQSGGLHAGIGRGQIAGDNGVRGGVFVRGQIGHKLCRGRLLLLGGAVEHNNVSAAGGYAVPGVWVGMDLQLIARVVHPLVIHGVHAVGADVHSHLSLQKRGAKGGPNVVLVDIGIEDDALVNIALHIADDVAGDAVVIEDDLRVVLADDLAAVGVEDGFIDPRVRIPADAGAVYAVLLVGELAGDLKIFLPGGGDLRDARLVEQRAVDKEVGMERLKGTARRTPS